MMDSASNLAPWEQVELLMQPAFIRLMDHLRHQLEQTDWVGQYETLNQWSEEISPEIQSQVLALLTKLEHCRSLQQQEHLESQLAELPQPIPVHLLHLSKDSAQVTFNLWELCYQICLQAYTPCLSRQTFVQLPPEDLVADISLFAETGEVDWMALDQKAATLVAAAFAQLNLHGDLL
jgi:hypothetical protein